MSKVDWGAYDDSDDDAPAPTDNAGDEVEDSDDDDFVIGSTLKNQRPQQNDEPEWTGGNNAPGESRNERSDRQDRRDRGGKGDGKGDRGGDYGKGRRDRGGKGDYGKGGGGHYDNFSNDGKGRKGGDRDRGGDGFRLTNADGSPRGANFMGGKFMNANQNKPTQNTASSIPNVVAPSGPPVERKKLQLLKRSVDTPLNSLADGSTVESAPVVETSPRASSIFGAGSPRDETIHKAKEAAVKREKKHDKKHQGKDTGAKKDSPRTKPQVPKAEDVAQLTEKLDDVVKVSTNDDGQEQSKVPETPETTEDGADSVVVPSSGDDDKKATDSGSNKGTPKGSEKKNFDKKKGSQGGKGGKGEGGKGDGGRKNDRKNDRKAEGKGGKADGNKGEGKPKGKPKDKGGKGGKKKSEPKPAPPPPPPVEEKKKPVKQPKAEAPAKKKPANIFAGLMDDSDSD